MLLNKRSIAIFAISVCGAWCIGCTDQAVDHAGVAPEQRRTAQAQSPALGSPVPALMLWGEPLPEPDLETLAHRCAPGYPYDETNTAIQELVYLRERPDPAAFPVLKQILEDDGRSTRTFGFLAAQALFTLGTPEAHALLRQRFASPVMQGAMHQTIAYALSYEMPQASAFIDRYVMTDPDGGLAPGMAARVQINPEVTQGGIVALAVTLTNRTDRTLAWLGFDGRYANIYAASVLYLRDEAGRYHPPVKLIRYDLPGSQIVRLKAGKDRTIPITLVPETTDAGLVVTAGDMCYTLPGPGMYEAVVLFERPHRITPPGDWVNYDGDQLHEGEAWWGGRIVSGPLRFRIEADFVDSEVGGG